MVLRRFARAAGCAVALIFIFISSLCAFAVRWVFATWVNLRMDELIYTLSTMTGAGGDMVGKFALSCLLPAAAVLAAASALLIFIIKKRRPSLRPLVRDYVLLSIIVFIISAGVFMNKMDVLHYVRTASTPSIYIENNYVDPAEVKLEFPDEKRNLIYIFLESTETTFADKASGGAFDENMIPELTRIAMENEDFSGDTAELNGAHVMSGCSWTMAAMFAHTSGLPLKISVGQNDMRYQDSFFSGVTTLGDILAAEGYNQTLLIGSDAEFGGRELYFTEHGNYNIRDYFHAAENGDIPENYYVWWGYEDYYLFENAKKELEYLAAQDAPFNLTMLTVDTHFEDGHICPYCEDTYSDQYSNVYACASRQISEFLSWIQQQDFYENTTVVIIGDHLTMDSDYCEDISGSYTRRVYTSFINSPVSPLKTYRRKYATFDMFPTTLAALGVDIPGNRLGLGTNLFSPIVTLLERDGYTAMNVELEKKSGFMEEIGAVKVRSTATVNIDYINPDNAVEITVSNIANAGDDIKSVNLTLAGDDGATRTFTLEGKNGTYAAVIDISFLPDRRATAEITATGGDGTRYILDSFYGDLSIVRRTDMDEYLAQLGALEHHTIFFAARDDASRRLPESCKALMRELGLENVELYYPNSYLAVITNGAVEAEQVSDETALTYSGTLPDEKPYSIKSAAFCYGNSASIMIDNAEYAADATGMNIVVYDNISGTVVGSAVYNVSAGVPTIPSASKFALAGADMRVEYLPDAKTLVVNVSDIDGVSGAIKSIVAELWSGTSEKQLVTLTGRFGRYSAAIDVSGYAGGDICLNINALAASTQYRLAFTSGELAGWMAEAGR